MAVCKDPVKVLSLRPSLDNTLSHHGVTREQLAVPCSEPLSNNFASKVDRWELLAPHIGLGERDIVEIKEDCRSYQEQRLGSLRKWREKFGSGATVISLVEALFEMRRLDLVGELCKIYSNIHWQQEAAAQAADSTPKKVPVEYERLLTCKEQLISEISCDLLTLSAKFAEKDLIPPSLVVDHKPQDSEEKAAEIVECLLKKVHFFPEKYNQLMSILTECSWMSDLVELLSGGPGSPSLSPPPEEIDKFPYLKDPSLNKEERDDLVAELEYRSKQIGRKFQVLVARTGRGLKQANTTVDELRTLFGREDRILKALRKTETMDKAIFKLSKLSSFFDYELLMSLVEKYCHDQELYDDFVAYSEELKVFCRRRVCEIPSDAFTSKKRLKSKGPYLRIKFDKNWQISGNQVKDLGKQISDILQIKLHLLAVKDGCMELVFNPLRSVSEPFSQQQKKWLREIGVLRIYVGEEEYSLTGSEEAEEQGVSENIDSSSQEYDKETVEDDTPAPGLSEEIKGCSQEYSKDKPNKVLGLSAEDIEGSRQEHIEKLPDTQDRPSKGHDLSQAFLHTNVPATPDHPPLKLAKKKTGLPCETGKELPRLPGSGGLLTEVGISQKSGYKLHDTPTSAHLYHQKLDEILIQKSMRELSLKSSISLSESSRRIQNLAWRKGAQLPFALKFSGRTTAGHDTAYFYQSNRVYSYSLTEDKWTELKSCQREEFGLAIVNNRLTVIGGCPVGVGPATNTLLSLTQDSSEMKWEELLPSMPVCQQSPLAVTTPSHLVVARRYSNVIDILDLSTLQWSSTQGLHVPVPWSVCITFCGKHLYLCNGDSIFSYSMENLVKSCSPSSITDSSSSWTRWENIPIPGSILTLVTMGGHVLAVTLRGSIHCYDKNTDSWSAVSETYPGPYHGCSTYVAVPPRNDLVVMDTINKETWIGNFVQ